MSSDPLVSLTNLPPGWRGRVMQLRTSSEVRLRLVQRGLMPGVLIDKVRTESDGKGIVIRLNFKEIRLTLREAGSILVEVIEESRSS